MSLLAQEPIQRSTVVDDVGVRLRAKILDSSREFAGQPLSEDLVAKAFGISRASARATLTDLVNDGVLRRSPNKPAEVVQMTKSMVLDVFRVRRPIELEAARLITKRALPVPEGAYRAIERLEALTSADAPSVIIDANLSFHRALVEGVNNLPLQRTFGVLEGEIALALAQSGVYKQALNAADEHRELLGPLEEHCWEDAYGLMLAHLRASAKDIAAHLDH